MPVREQVDIIIAGLNGEVGALLSDLDKGVLSRREAERILALTLDSAKREIKAIIPPGYATRSRLTRPTGESRRSAVSQRRWRSGGFR